MVPFRLDQKDESDSAGSTSAAGPRRTDAITVARLEPGASSAGRMRTSAMTFTYTITFTLDAAALPPVTGSEEQRAYWVTPDLLA